MEHARALKALRRTSWVGGRIALAASLARLGGKGEIADATLAEISRLDAGEGAQVPQLATVLAAFGERIDFNL